MSSMNTRELEQKTQRNHAEFTISSSHQSSNFIPLADLLSLDYHFHSSIRIQGMPIHDSDQPRPASNSGHKKYVVDDEWVVAGRHDSVNSTGVCGALSPLEESLSPLEEEFLGSHPQDRPWTPAGQATSENEKESFGVHILQSQYFFNQYSKSRHFDLQNVKCEKKQILQKKLAAAVFAHRHPLRHYCLDAYATAVNVSLDRGKQSAASTLGSIKPHRHGCPGELPDSTRNCPILNPHTLDGCAFSPKRSECCFQLDHGNDSGKQGHRCVCRIMKATVVHTVPMSVFLKMTELACELSVNVLLSMGRIGILSAHRFISTCRNSVDHVMEVSTKVTPSHVFEFVVNVQRRAMGKTGDVLASGIQSVATGVGSVSNAALNRLSRQGLALAGGVVGGSRSGLSRGGMGPSGFGRARKDMIAGEKVVESKLFQRLQRMENVSRLIAYTERTGEALSLHAKKRAQRMMHYNVSFRPFTATVEICSPIKMRKIRHYVSHEISHTENESYSDDDGDYDDDSISSESQSSSGSIFMRTPTSFPPTPTSRIYYLERGSRFTENVVFLARDQLRVERGMGNHNEQTRAMSKALMDGSRLAVFDATDASCGISLSCGQHIATKVGNTLYCSTRSMIPVMRNSYVYFEISVSPSPIISDPSTPTPQGGTATLSVGLSTLAMPLDTLVGAWSGSVGLCSTGQILQEGQWLSPRLTSRSSYGSNSTIGCLVYLDDNLAYDNAGGLNISVDVTFNINGIVIPPSLYFGSTGQYADVPSDGCEPTLSLTVGQVHELFPTVTLHSPATCVMCRFSAEDLLASSRSEIGALSGVLVYAVDGSVVLDSNEGDDDFLVGSSPCDQLSDKVYS